MVTLMKVLKFSAYWNKLLEDHFTTIRSKNFIEKIDEGEIMPYIVKGNPFGFVRVESVENIKIRDIPLQVLTKDVETLNFTIVSHREFLDLFNNLNMYDYTFKMDSIVTLVKLTKLKGE